MTSPKTRTALSLLAASSLFAGCAGQAKSTATEESRAAASLASAPTAGSAAPAPLATPRLRTGEELEAHIRTLLNGYERVPTDEDWKQLGPEALVVLDKLISAPDTLPSIKSRAISSLSQVQNPDALARLETLVGNGSLEPHLRATAILALASRGGQPTQPTLSPLLKDRDAQVREAAARALGRLGSAAARQALTDSLSAEKDPVVRDAIEVGLSQSRE